MMMPLLGLLLWPALQLLNVSQFQGHPQHRARVLLHLGDPEGKPFLGASSECQLELPLSNTRRLLSPSSIEWPPVAQVFCVPRKEDSTIHPDLSWSELSAQATEIEPGSFLFEVERGYSYILGVRGGNVPCTSVEFDCREGGEGSSLATTHLCLQVDVADVRRLQVHSFEPNEFKALHRVSVRIEDAKTGLPLIQRDSWGNSAPAFWLPEGSYLVRSTSCGATGLCGQDADEGALYGGGQARVCLSECRDDVWVFMDRGGRLELDWTAEPRPNRWAVGETIEVFLHGAEGWPLRVEFLIANRSLMPFCWPGAVTLSEPIPAGEYRLVARAADGRLAEAQVIVRNGQTLPLTLRFEASVGASQTYR